MYLMYKVDIHYIHVHKIKDIRLYTVHFPKQLLWCVAFLISLSNGAFL